MSEETRETKVEQPGLSPTDWREAFEHAAKAAREAFSAAADATAEMLRQGTRLAEQTVTEAHRTVVVTLDSKTVEIVDKLVAAGVHKSRQEAIRHLIQQGLKASGDLLARIDKVEAEIDALRSKMRGIPIEGEETN
jgi:Arc/MetJ-type ribon-helix-helix transcriptional regulator